MNNENINKEFDPGKDFAEQYNEILSKINVGSPVHKVNFDDLSENNILGMFLLSEDGAMELLSEAVDKSNVNKNTYLFFESRHVVECCQILIGAFIALNDNPSIDKEFDYNVFLLNSPKRLVVDTKNVYVGKAFSRKPYRVAGVRGAVLEHHQCPYVVLAPGFGGDVADTLYHGCIYASEGHLVAFHRGVDIVGCSARVRVLVEGAYA